MTLDQFRGYCLGKSSVTEETPFDSNTLVYKVVGKIFAFTDLADFASVSLKVDPEIGIDLKERCASVQPAYHLNMKHWVSVLMDGRVPDNLFLKWVDASYDLVVAKLTKSDKSRLLSLVFEYQINMTL